MSGRTKLCSAELYHTPPSAYLLFVAQSSFAGFRASSWSSWIPLIFPYSHFRAIVLAVMSEAEKLKSRARCPVLRSSNSG